MKKLITFIFCFLLFFNNTKAQAQDCDAAVLMNIKGSWKKESDANMRPDKNQSQINSRIDAVSKLFQIAYPEPKGLVAEWYRTMEGKPLVNNGPVTYQLNSLYLAWYCNSNLHKAMLGTETSTWSFVWMNSFGWLIADQYDKALVKVQGLQAWWLAKKIGEWKGLSLYEPTGSPKKGKAVLITRNNQLPYKPVTRLQFLNAMKEKIEADKKTQLDFENKRTVRSAADEDIARQHGLEGALKNVPPNRIEQRKADYLKHYKTEQQRKDENIHQTETYYNSLLNPLTDELNKESDIELQQPAIVDNNSNIFKGFTTDEKGGRMMVIVNPEYFKSNLPRYAPQMIVLYWSWDKNGPCQDFKKQLEENFPVEQLKAMIDK
jgi:hypothetical protein